MKSKNHASSSLSIKFLYSAVNVNILPIPLYVSSYFRIFFINFPHSCSRWQVVTIFCSQEQYKECGTHTDSISCREYFRAFRPVRVQKSQDTWAHLYYKAYQPPRQKINISLLTWPSLRLSSNRSFVYFFINAPRARKCFETSTRVISIF